MKKILSLILFLTLATQSFVFVMAENGASEKKSNEALSFLQSLDIMYADNDNPEDKVTREDFALYIGRMLRIDELEPADSRYFNDLDMDGYNTGVINALTEMGIISQSDDRRFRPTDYITGNEALKMLLCTLGYGEYCEVSGGYPFGYVKIAAQTGISIDADILTVLDAAEVIFEVMKAPMYLVNGVSPDGLHYYESEKYTILSTYWDVNFKEGTVESVYTGTLGGMLQFAEDEISVNGKQYTLSEGLVADEYLASYVTIFYTKDTEEIFWICEENSLEHTKIDVKDFIALDGNTVKYYSSNKTKYISVEQPNIIYNGIPLKSEVEKTLNGLTKGIITLKDRDDDGDYDVILVDDYTTFIVSAVEPNTQKIYNKLSGTDVLSCNDYSNVRIATAGGDMVDFSVIEKDSIISVAKSKGKEVLRLLISEASGTGILTQTKVSDGTFKACIDGIWYTIDKQYADVYKTTLTGGLAFNQTYVFSTDAFGDIVYLKQSTGDTGELGYIIAIREEGIFSKEVFIKLLAADDTVKIFSVPERLKIDGTTHRDIDKQKIETLIADARGNVAQLVRYIASDEEITMIDTQKFVEGVEDESNTLTSTFGDANTQRWFTTNRVGIKGIIDASTVAFCVPYNASADDKDYHVCANTAVVTNNGFYYADTYRLHTRPGVAKAMVVRYTDDTIFKNYLYNQKTFLVDEISAGINDDGDIVTLVSGYENGVKLEYKVDAAEISFDTVEKGDLVLFSYDVYGNPVKSNANDSGFIMLYDQSIGGLPDSNVWKGMMENGKDSGRTLYTLSTNASYEYYNAQFQLSFGYVADAYEGVVSWGWRDPKEISEYANCSGIPVIIIEETERDIEVYKGSVDDIQGYKSTEANYSRVIYHAYGSSGRAIYVYK